MSWKKLILELALGDVFVFSSALRTLDLEKDKFEVHLLHGAVLPMGCGRIRTVSRFLCPPLAESY